MNPQSLSFVPSDDSNPWRLSNAMRNLQEVQDQHGERLRSLERRLDDDGRVKSLWGPASPFPNAMGTPNHGPIQPPSNDFASFDDDAHSANMVRSLQLDADDEPRRVGATSRANSVRFDESANHGASHWSTQHSTRPSGECISRTPSGLSGLGGHPMFERSSSHKSDGKQSSTGPSLAGGRANSFGLALDTLSGPDGDPGVTPFLSILGSPPAIVRCWLNLDFTATSMLYAAVCTGSYKSFLDMHLITALGYTGQIREDITGERKIKLPMYFPEAKSSSASSRTSSPAPALPNVTVDFAVLDSGDESGRAIRIYLGSDTLRAHNGDVLFSMDCLTLFDGDRHKLTVPFARPEDERLFKGLRTVDARHLRASVASSREHRGEMRSRSNGIATAPARSPALRSDSVDRKSTAGSDTDTLSKSEPLLRHLSARDSSAGSVAERRSDDAPDARKTSLTQLNTSRVPDPHSSSSANIDSPPLTGASRGGGSSPAIWSNWRRDGSSAAAAADWPASTRTGRTAGGIKVLKPARQASRSSGPSSASASTVGTSTPAAPSGSPTPGQSRFFDDGKRRAPVEAPPAAAAPGKVTKANPIGGASAFSWMSGSK